MAQDHCVALNFQILKVAVELSNWESSAIVLSYVRTNSHAACMLLC